MIGFNTEEGNCQLMCKFWGNNTRVMILVLIEWARDKRNMISESQDTYVRKFY